MDQHSLRAVPDSKRRLGPTWLLQVSEEWPLWNPSHTIDLSLFEQNDTEPPTTIPSETTSHY
jgi:hypothetical protein